MKNEFRIFPDIRLICDDIPGTGYIDIVEISCCLRGICEYQTESGYTYLTKGHYIIFKHDKYSECNITHSANCHIMTVLVDSQLGNKDIYELTGSVDHIQELQTNRAYLFDDERIMNVFSEIYKEYTDERINKLKIKTLELLMLLNEQKIKTHSREETVLNAGRFICSHLSEHYTISQLSEIFEIDGTTLKKLFSRIYGCPVYNYAKNRKMFRAAELLRTTDMKVIDIAEEVGYSNASKFSSAFRYVMSVNPKYYQMEYKTLSKTSNNGILRNIAY